MLQRFAFFLLILGWTSASCAQETKAAKSDQLYWIFLNSGKSSADVAKEEIQKMHEAHLDNFKRLAKDGKLLAAGPMRDPDKKKRGIVVVKATNLDGLNKYFEPDPYIQNGYLAIEAIPMEPKIGGIHTSLEPTGLEELRLVVLTRANQDAESKNSLDGVVDLPGVKYAARFNDSKTYQGIAVFAGKDDAPVQAAMESLPAIKSGHLKATIIPLYVGKGTFDVLSM